jgi:hypothetical protein
MLKRLSLLAAVGSIIFIAGCGILPPATPAEPAGPSTGAVGVSYRFTAVSHDPRNLPLRYQFDWGDGADGEWSQYRPSGEPVWMDHAWRAAGAYVVRVRAQNAAGRQSEWSPRHVVAIGDGGTGWAKTFGGASTDDGASVLQSADGGYVVAGSVMIDYHPRFRLIKTDALGNQEWDKTLGIVEGDVCSVISSSDGGYVVEGPGGSGTHLLKTDAAGNIVWVKSFPGPGPGSHGTCYSVCQTTDGGYIMVGDGGPMVPDSGDVYVLKTDADGNQVWSRTFGGASADAAWSVQPARGGYVIAGSTLNGHEESYACLTKIDESGNQVWSRTFTSPGYAGFRSVAVTSDGGFIATGYALVDGSWDVLLVQADADGSEVWSRTFGGSFADDGHEVRPTADGGCVIAGKTESFGAGSSDVYLLKTDANGDTVWTRTFGGAANDYGNSIKVTTDGGYIVCGSTMSYGAGYFDVWLIKTDANGDVE